MAFSDSPESLPQCQLILEQSQVQMRVAIHCKEHTQYLVALVWLPQCLVKIPCIYMCWTLDVAVALFIVCVYCIPPH